MTWPLRKIPRLKYKEITEVELTETHRYKHTHTHTHTYKHRHRQIHRDYTLDWERRNYKSWGGNLISSYSSTFDHQMGI